MPLSVKSLTDIEAHDNGKINTRMLIDSLALHYHYRPLPKRIREGVLKQYYQNLNGFDEFKVPHI